VVVTNRGDFKWAHTFDANGMITTGRFLTQSPDGVVVQSSFASGGGANFNVVWSKDNRTTITKDIPTDTPCIVERWKSGRRFLSKHAVFDISECVEPPGIVATEQPSETPPSTMFPLPPLTPVYTDSIAPLPTTATGTYTQQIRRQVRIRQQASIR